MQDLSQTVAIKSITKKSLAKSQNLLGKEIKILKVSKLLQYIVSKIEIIKFRFFIYFMTNFHVII